MISAVNVAEVIDFLVRVAGRPIDSVLERMDWLLVGGLTIEPVTEAMGREAGTLRAERYHRVRNRLSMADCVALATAHLSLATSDPELAITARYLGVDVIALPDSRGVTP